MTKPDDESDGPPVRALLDEQQRYYCARAPEYDRWWHRRGRYDLGAEGNRIWWGEVAEARAWLDETPLEGQVLELAGGTGNWSEYLAARANRLTVVDGSAEMLALNEARLAEAGVGNRVVYRQADLFGWRPEGAERYDAVFFSFWLSHVPDERVDDFLATVAGALRPGGWLGILDNRPGSVDRSHHGTLRLDRDRERRQLEDGRTFEIVKRFALPSELVARLGRAGLAAQARQTTHHFIVATAQRS